MVIIWRQTPVYKGTIKYDLTKDWKQKPLCSGINPCFCINQWIKVLNNACESIFKLVFTRKAVWKYKCYLIERKYIIPNKDIEELLNYSCPLTKGLRHETSAMDSSKHDWLSSFLMLPSCCIILPVPFVFLFFLPDGFLFVIYFLCLYN